VDTLRDPALEAYGLGRRYGDMGSEAQEAQRLLAPLASALAWLLLSAVLLLKKLKWGLE